MATVVDKICSNGGAMVYADLAAAGARTQKTSTFLVTAAARAAAELELGTLRAHAGSDGKHSLVGKTATGEYASSEAEVYTPQLCKLLAKVMLESHARSNASAATPVRSLLNADASPWQCRPH